MIRRRSVALVGESGTMMSVLFLLCLVRLLVPVVAPRQALYLESPLLFNGIFSFLRWKPALPLVGEFAMWQVLVM